MSRTTNSKASATRRFFYACWRLVKLAWLILRAWLFNIAVAIDVLVNTVVGGSRYETISSRVGKGRNKGQPVHTVVANVVDLLFLVLFNDKDHCQNSIQHDRGGNAISEVIDRYRKGKKHIWFMG